MKTTGRMAIWLLGLLASAGGKLARSDALSANPYLGIADRNAFGLRPPPLQPPARPEFVSTNAAPELSLTGIADFSAKKWALLMSAESGQPPRRYTLKEGESQDDLEVLGIDGVNGNVRIRYRGIESVLSLAGPEKNRDEAQAAVKPFVQERVRAEELLTQRERDLAAADPGVTTGQFLPHSERVHSATFTPDGKFVISSDESNSVRVWDLTTGQPIAHAGRDQSPAFTPDGKLVISIDGSDSVRVWDAGTGQLLQPQR